MRSFHLGLLFTIALITTVNCKDEPQQPVAQTTDTQQKTSVVQRTCDLPAVKQACQQHKASLEAETRSDKAQADLAKGTWESLLLEFGKDAPTSAPAITLHPVDLDEVIIGAYQEDSLDCNAIVSCDDVTREVDFVGSFYRFRQPSKVTEFKYTWKGTWAETASFLLTHKWIEGEDENKIDWQNSSSLVSSGNVYPTSSHRFAVGALLKDEVRFSTTMHNLVGHVDVARKILPEDWWNARTKLLSVFMEAALTLNYQEVMKAYKAYKTFQQAKDDWRRECSVAHELLPKCSQDLCTDHGKKGECEFEKWDDRRPNPGPDTHVGDSDYDTFAKTPSGWLMRRYADGGADRINLLLVWGTIVADEADMDQAGEWAAGTLARLESAKGLKMAPYYRRALGEIVKRRGKGESEPEATQAAAPTQDPEEAMKRMADEDRKRAKATEESKESEADKP